MNSILFLYATNIVNIDKYCFYKLEIAENMLIEEIVLYVDKCKSFEVGEYIEKTWF